MMDNTGITDLLLDGSDYSTSSSAVEMSSKDMAKKIQKFEAELFTRKNKAKSGNVAEHSASSIMLGLQIGEKLGKVEKAVETLGMEIGELRVKNVELKAATHIEHSAFGVLQEEMAKIKKAFDGLNVAINDEEKAAALEELKGTNKELMEEVGKLDEENIFLKEELSRNWATLERVQKGMVEMREEIGAKNAEFDAKFVGNGQQDLEKVKNEFKTTNDQMKKKIEKLAKENVEKEKIIITSIAKIEQKIDGLNVANNEEKNRAMEGEIAEMKEKFSKLIQECAKMKGEIVGLKKGNAHLEEKMRILEEQQGEKPNVNLHDNAANTAKEMHAEIEFVGSNIIFGDPNPIAVEMKNNKFNPADCGPNLTISQDGLVVKHPGLMGRNCVRALYPVPEIILNASEPPSIACYFEIRHLKNSYDSDITAIGFCCEQFLLENDNLGDVNNSIGFRNKNGLWVDAFITEFQNKRDRYFEIQDIIGIGIIHRPASSSPLECFATCNGKLLGTIKLAPKYTSLQLFPAVTLFSHEHSIRVNFGKEKWLFNPEQLIQQ